MAPIGFFVQDEWHVRSNLTINVGLRYDYDPAVKLLVSNGETVNALNLPAGQFIIGDKQSSAYTTGCGSPQTPPCVPGGLFEFQPRVQGDRGRRHVQHAEQHLVLQQPAGAEGDQGQHRAAHRHRLGLHAQDRSARGLWDLLRSDQLSQPVRGEHAAGFHLAVDARRLRHAQHRADGNGRHSDGCADLQHSWRAADRTAATGLRSSPAWRAATRSWWRPRRGAPPSAATPTTRTIPIRARSSGTSRSSDS